MLAAGDTWKQGSAIIQSLDRKNYRILSANISVVQDGVIVTVVCADRDTLSRVWSSLFDRGYDIEITKDLVARITVVAGQKLKPRDSSAITLSVADMLASPDLADAHVNQID